MSPRCFRSFRRYVCFFIHIFIAVRFFVSPFCLFFFQMFLALESGPPLVAVGILLFRNWRTSYRQQSWFPRRLELSILTGGRLLDGRSLLLPKRRLTPDAVYALQWAHNLAGLPSPVDASTIRDISKAAKKMNGARVVNRKQAGTADKDFS